MTDEQHRMKVLLCSAFMELERKGNLACEQALMDAALSLPNGCEREGHL
jgi:hypothetical protein